MLESIFGNPTVEKVLLYLQNYNEGYASEIADTFSISLSVVQKQLKRLEDGGVIVSQPKDRTRLFLWNPRYPFRKELQSLLDKSFEFMPEAEVKKYYRKRLRPRRTGKTVRITKKSDIQTIASIVCDCLLRNGIEAVLSGGAVVSIYTNNEYESKDLDFISSSG